MPNRSSRKLDINQLAAEILKATTENTPKTAKNPHAAALGKLGGLKGGKARAAKLSPRQRTKIARKAAKARWKKPAN